MNRLTVASLAMAELVTSAMAILAPPPRLHLSDWSDTYRILSPEASEEHGQWRTDRVPYMREPMNCVTDPRVRKIVGMFGSQLGKTECFALNPIGYHIHLDPCPILFVDPTTTSMEGVSKERVAPMLRDTPVLSEIVGDGKSRDGDNTIELKSFRGGRLAMVGSNAPSGLASRPIRLVIGNEIDRWASSAGGEGSPRGIVEKRTSNFHNAKIIYNSSPTLEGSSAIAQEYENSDRCIYLVPCPGCHHEQELRWACVRWETGKPKTARYHCESCALPWDDATRHDAVALGRWQATNPEADGSIRGFRLNAIASPWLSLAKLVEEFLAAQDDTDQLQTFVNTRLAETWKPPEQRIDSGGLAARREDYGVDPIPERVVYISVGADVQDDRIELEYVGWAMGEESFGLAYEVIPGDPAHDANQCWQQLAQALSRTFAHPSGRRIGVGSACIDSGHLTQNVYKFCRPRWGSRVWASKGRGGADVEAVAERFTTNNVEKCPLLILGTDRLKEILWNRWNRETPGPGSCHFPRSYTDFWFEGIRSEKRIEVKRHGVPVVTWVRERGVRNEPLDCRVGALGAMLRARPPLDALSVQMGLVRPAEWTVPAGVLPPSDGAQARQTAPSKIQFQQRASAQQPGARRPGRIDFGRR